MQAPLLEAVKSSHDSKRVEVISRLPEFYDAGFVVSKSSDGFQHQGDGLFFSGLALYALDCADGQPIANAFAEMFRAKDGGAYRHPSQADREVSLDGLLALFRGINKRIDKCGERDFWAPLMAKTRAAVSASMPAEFNLISAMMAYKLGLSDVPDLRRMDLLGLEVVTWANLVRNRQAACYRIHLGLLALQTMEEMGAEISDKTRAAFADATNGLEMRTSDHFSGRSGLGDWLSGFSYDAWQYAHQRCPIWEKNDSEGMQHPAVDYLVGYSDFYERNAK